MFLFLILIINSSTNMYWLFVHSKNIKEDSFIYLNFFIINNIYIFVVKYYIKILLISLFKINSKLIKAKFI